MGNRNNCHIIFLSKCQTNFGYDYYIQPTSPKSTYFKKGRFDDESECA